MTDALPQTEVPQTEAPEAGAVEIEDPADAERGPNRRCLVSRAIAPRESLMRLVVDPEGRLMADIDGKLPGRGLWITPTAAAMEQAIAGRLFTKAARRPVAVPQDFLPRLQEMLMRRLLDQLGLARRAGKVAMGFDAVLAEIIREDGGKNYRGLLIAASDAAENGRDKLRQKARRAERLDFLDSSTISKTLGRDAIIHAAVPDSGFTARIVTLRDRLISLFPSAASAKPQVYSEEAASST